MRKSGTGDISTRITERKGVCEIERRCCLINWVFRERGHSDFGIDADMEESVLEGDEYHLTNRHIAIQIKSGESYVKFDQNRGFYYFDIDSVNHANYWLGSDRPVVVMVYEAPKDFDGDLKTLDKDELFGSVYWAQIKLSNFEKVQNRNSKNDKDPEATDNAKHIYARVYLTEKFTSDSATVFSNIISSYIPTYDSDLQVPSEFNNDYYNKMPDRLSITFNRTTEFIDDILKWIDPSENSISENEESLFLAIEELRMGLLYNLNIDNLRIVRYHEIVKQLLSKDPLNFLEFREYCKNAIQKICDAISGVEYILTIAKKDIDKVTCPGEVQRNLVKQTLYIIDDYLRMLQENRNQLSKTITED